MRLAKYANMKKPAVAQRTPWARFSLRAALQEELAQSAPDEQEGRWAHTESAGRNEEMAARPPHRALKRAPRSGVLAGFSEVSDVIQFA